MKLKEHPDFPEGIDGGNYEENDFEGGWNKVLSELGEIDLDQFLKEKGWVKDFPHWLADMPEDKVDAFCKMRGYIKLSDVELDVEKVAQFLFQHIGEGVIIRASSSIEIATALSKAKDLLKVKGE